MARNARNFLFLMLAALVAVTVGAPIVRMFLPINSILSNLNPAKGNGSNG